MKTFTILAFMLLIFNGFSQTVVTQNVTHAVDGTPDNTNGCTYVRLIVDYTVSGVGYSVSSTNTLLNGGNSITLSATVPGAGRPTITGKKLVISSSSYSYTYTITGTSNYQEYNNGWCFCNGARTAILMITETATNISYQLTHPMSQPCY